MKKRRRIKKGPVAIALLILLMIIFFILLGIYNLLLSPVSKNKDYIEFVVENGENYLSLVNKLKKERLIKSSLAYRIYVKTHKLNNLKTGTYHLQKSMSTKEIVKTLSGQTQNKQITFLEGVNIDKIVSIIADNTKYSKDDIYAVLNDETFINQAINDYWFLTDDIKNKEIYYALEGYLFPDTYEINESTSIKDIIIKMLDATEMRLDNFKTDIDNSTYSIHELMTLASMLELEENTFEKRKQVAGVFINRLKASYSLGSDVTAYYAARVDIEARDLTEEERDACNAYNTRCLSMRGKLPVGPICSPSLKSLEAALYPEINDYYFFLNDVNGELYLTKTNKEHEELKEELKRQNLWHVF